MANFVRCGFLFAFACLCAAQTDRSPQFEVASLKPAEGTGFGRFSGGPGSSDPERVTYQRATLELLIQNAWDLGLDQVSGPSWLQTDWFTVTAKLPPGTTMAQFRQMLANLLIERFGLVFHRLTKNVPGYEITVAKGGPRLAPATSATLGETTYYAARGPDGLMHVAFRQTSMNMMANRIALLSSRFPGSGPGGRLRIMDKTGLSGKFDFDLAYEPPDFQPPNQAPAEQAADPGFDMVGLSRALEKQLGLKLTAIKIPVDFLAIDHAERVPAGN